MTDEQPYSEQPTPNQPAAPQPPHDGREWVAVAPPHPYAAQQKTPVGKGLAVSAMALGLSALLTASVVFFGAPRTFAWLAGLLAVIAVGVGIMALVQGSRPTAGAAVGLAGGVIALPLALLLALTNMALPAGSTEEAQSQSNSGEAWTPDTPQEMLLEWPRNMATGGLSFAGPGDPRLALSDAPEAATAPAAPEIDRASKNDVLIYVDYRCPHCMMFEQTNADFLEQVIADGKTTVQIVPLSFMDRISEGAYYSSRAAGAVSCLADAQPEAVWAAHHMLLTSGVQPGQGPGLSNDEIVEVLEAATGGLTTDARSCIEGEKFVPFAQSLNNWVFANPVPNALDSDSRLSGTPSVFVNGAFYEGASDDAAAFEAFFKEHAS